MLTNKSGLCIQASKKLHAFSKISTYMDLDKHRMVMKSFFLTQFSYCPLVWMCHSCELNNRINRLHERSLRFVYRDNINSFEEFTIHKRNIQNITIELLIVKQGITPKLMSGIFTLKENRLHCSKQIFVTHNVRTVHNRTETLSFLGPKIWLIIPEDIRNQTH